MKGYETVFITHPDLEEDKLKKLLRKFKSLIKKAKGKLAQEYLWGRRRLAYQIANLDFGVYHVWYLTGSGTMLDELHKQFRFTDELLRFQSILVENVDEEALFFSEMLKVQQEEVAALATSAVNVALKPDGKVEPDSAVSSEQAGIGRETHYRQHIIMMRCFVMWCSCYTNFGHTKLSTGTAQTWFFVFPS